MENSTATKERPILFSGPMVRAILAGKKTQTRRVIKPQPVDLGNGCWTLGEKVCVSDAEMEDHLFHEVYGTKGTPYGAMYESGGDRIWVRETFGQFWGGVHYRATDDRPDLADQNWKPSIFMPRKLSRITLEITDVRVERLQQITLPDVAAEGFPPNHEEGWDTTEGFRKLWDKLNGKTHSWESNPWLWVIEFKRVQS